MEIYLIAGIILSIISGCGAKSGHIDSPLDQYVDRFKVFAIQERVEVEEAVEDLDIVFGTLGKNEKDLVILGNCTLGIGTERAKITINKDSWSTLQDFEREEVVLHELGHCALGRSHNDAVQTMEGIPNAHKSVMNSSTSSIMSLWILYHEAYIHELFHPYDYRFKPITTLAVTK